MWDEVWVRAKACHIPSISAAVRRSPAPSNHADFLPRVALVGPAFIAWATIASAVWPADLAAALDGARVAGLLAVR